MGINVKTIIEDSISSIISGIIILLVPFAGTIIYKFYNDISYLETYQKFTTLTVPLYSVIIGLVLLIVILKFYNRIQNRKPAAKLKMLKLYNSKRDSTLNLLIKWSVSLRGINPIASQMTFYCTNHPSPLRLINNRCSDNNCHNSNTNVNTLFIRNIVESELADYWDKLNR